ncbi:hypothetical protein OF83DRAFT_1047452, partial [Amylostereum chailletii]
PDKLYERALYIGIAFSSILYGMSSSILLLYRAHSSLTDRGSSRNCASWRARLFNISYVVVMFVFLTVSYVADAYMGQLMWIEHRDFQGGPYPYYLANSTLWINVIGSATDILANVLCDAYLLYRCYIIWESRLSIVAFPALVYLASFALSITTLVESALPNSSAFVQQTVNFATPWVSLSVVLNIMLTGLISYRILRARYSMREAFDGLEAPAKDIYTSAVAILVEAELPFTILGVVNAVNEGKNTYVASAWCFIWGSFSVISPLLIILRVFMGKGRTCETSTQLTQSISF